MRRKPDAPRLWYARTGELMFEIEQQDTKDFGPCDCCSSMSRTVTGCVARDGEAYAVYRVHWTLGQVERHGASFYIILGYFGEGTMPIDRYAVALRYRCDSKATGFMVIDAEGTPIAEHPLAERALRREEVIGTPLAQEVFDLVDFIWLHEERISEITKTPLS
jgi:hypothetical protein